MGYFVRKLRRSVSAAQKSALGVVRVSEEWLAAPVKAPVGEKYLRLETRVRDEDSKELAGVFVTAYELLRRGDLGREEHTTLDEALKWFEKNLTIPRDVTERAVFGFKGDANVLISQTWRIVRALREHGHDVRMIRRRRVGKIMYEDKHQVAAIPR